MELYSHVPYHNNTIIKTHTGITDAMIKTQEDFFNKIFTSHFICKGTRGYSKFARERSWRPNITEIFWPQCYGRQHCVFLVLQGCTTGVLESSLLGAGFPYYNSSLSSSNSTQLCSFCSIRRPYITFKLPHGDMDMPPRLRNFFRYLAIGVSLPLSLERPVWSSSSGNNCHAVQRSLSSGASVYESIMGFFLTRPISSANFHPSDFLS